MSDAHRLLLEVGWMPGAPDQGVAYEKLCQAASLWRTDGQYFSAGVAMLRAVEAAWGYPEKMGSAQIAAQCDLELAIEHNTSESPVSLAAIYKLQQSMTRAIRLFDVDGSVFRTRIRELKSELAQRLLGYFSDSEHVDNYLVRGFVLVTNFDGDWSVRFPDHEVSSGIEQFGSELLLNMPSAFHLLVRDQDWQGAYDVVQMRENAFTAPALNAWRAVVLAHVEPGRAVEWFDEATKWFSADVMPSSEELMRTGGSWSSINQQLWAKYFYARARLIESIRVPSRVRELLSTAVESLVGTEAGWHSGEVSRFRVLVSVLEKLVSNPQTFSLDAARREYELEVRISEETIEDRLAITFITEAANAFKGFESEPESALTSSRLSIALDALARIPTIGPDVTESVRPALGRSALAIVFGPIRTWMHRALSSIADEASLRGVLLRLLQGGLPLYAQIRHGPIEYGKDIVALLEVDSIAVLRHYQVKCGDIDKRKWRESKDELEEMFLVPFSTLQLPRAPQRIEGVLVTNGHANPYVEPVMDGWIQHQRQDFGREVEFMHLDGLVDWIAENRLVNELKVALREQGVQF